MAVVLWTNRVARDEDFTESRWLDPQQIIRVHFRALHPLGGIVAAGCTGVAFETQEQWIPF